MKTGLLLILILSISLANAQQVIFGEKHLLEAVNSIYFDKDGMLYPDLKISNESLNKAGCSLINWYNSNNALTDSLLEVFGIPNVKVQVLVSDGESLNPAYDPQSLSTLNDSLLYRKIRELDALAKGNGLEFYIHGFRKSYLENEKDVTSVTEFAYLTASLDSNRIRKNLVVRVYWDGTYDCCFSRNFKKNRELFELFKKAGTNADKVALSFTKMLNRSTSAKINMVAHSLGSKIAVKSVMESSNSGAVFNVCLIAPAIPGKLIKTYYESNVFHPHCNWLIFYNKKDFVLKKKDNKIGLLGPGAYRYEVTTLGCNKRNDAKKLKSWMSKNRPGVEFELVNKTAVGKCHSLRCYTKNNRLIEVSDFLEKEQ